MIRWLDDYMSALYPPESNHFLDVAALLAPNVRFFVAREGVRGVGCGALVVHGAGGASYGEVKRMYVDPALRGRGLGRLILDALEASYPMLRGTIRDHVTQARRPFLRFFACGEDWSLESPDAALPSAIASGDEPFLVIGAIAGG